MELEKSSVYKGISYQKHQNLKANFMDYFSQMKGRNKIGEKEKAGTTSEKVDFREEEKTPFDLKTLKIQESVDEEDDSSSPSSKSDNSAVATSLKESNVVIGSSIQEQEPSMIKTIEAIQEIQSDQNVMEIKESIEQFHDIQPTPVFEGN